MAPAGALLVQPRHRAQRQFHVVLQLGLARGQQHRLHRLQVHLAQHLCALAHHPGQRQRLGLTQSEAADLLEVSASWVDKAEREIRTPIKITQEGALARITKAKRPPKE